MTNHTLYINCVQRVTSSQGKRPGLPASPPAGSPFQGHPAVLSVAPPVIPPPMNMGGPPPPPPPPGPPPPAAVAPQPPLPPPLPIGGGSHGDEPPAQTGLAAMIAGAKLRRVQRVRQTPVHRRSVFSAICVWRPSFPLSLPSTAGGQQLFKQQK